MLKGTTPAKAATMKTRQLPILGAVVACAGLVLSLAVLTPTTYADTTAQPEVNAKAETAADADTTANPEATTSSDLPDPTFSVEVDQQNDIASFWFGSNLFAFGNLLELGDATDAGLLLAAGSELNLGATSDYGFVAGVAVNYTGTTSHDLFILASNIELDSAAHIGGDVYAAGNVMTVAADLPSDLSVAAAELTLRDVTIAGNLNLSVDRLNFEGDVKIHGTLNYNADAVLSGDYDAAATSTYEVIEPSPAAVIAATIYSKLLSIAGLFITTIVFLALFPSLYQQLVAKSTTQRFGFHLTAGLVALVAVPLVSLFAFCTIAAAPLAVIVMVAYAILVYLAQGITGTWLGHLITAQLFKRPANRFIEALVGIVLLGLVSLIPFLGWITGFLALLFGLGFIAQAGFLRHFKNLKSASPAKSAKAAK